MTANLDSANAPQDRLPSAAQLEIEKIETIQVVWRDHKFTVDSSAENWPVEVTYAFENRLIATGLRGILGEKQWAEFLTTKPRNTDLGNLFDAIAGALGLGDAGN